MEKEFAGLTAIITGAGSGIGLEVAKGLKGHGAIVYGFDINEGEMAPVATFIKCDIGNGQSVTDAFAEFSKQSKQLDILVNNAAAGTHTPPQDTTLEIWDTVIGTSLTGYFLNAREFSKLVIAAKKPGAIVNISSIAGSSAIGRGNFAYSVAKGGVNQMTRELAIEWAKSKIRVNAIQPCSVNTPGWRKWVETEGEKAKPLMELLVRGIPMGRVAEPEDIAHAVHFLASDAAAMVTGTILPVDGGNLAYNAGGTLGDY